MCVCVCVCVCVCMRVIETQRETKFQHTTHTTKPTKPAHSFINLKRVLDISHEPWRVHERDEWEFAALAGGHLGCDTVGGALNWGERQTGRNEMGNLKTLKKGGVRLFWCSIAALHVYVCFTFKLCIFRHKRLFSNNDENK